MLDSYFNYALHIIANVYIYSTVVFLPSLVKLLKKHWVFFLIDIIYELKADCIQSTTLQDSLLLHDHVATFTCSASLTLQQSLTSSTDAVTERKKVTLNRRKHFADPGWSTAEGDSGFKESEAYTQEEHWSPDTGMHLCQKNLFQFKSDNPYFFCLHHFVYLFSVLLDVVTEWCNKKWLSWKTINLS